jgi:hypothetical protein
VFRRRRHRRCIAWIALFGLLFQQIAMAAYVCPIEQSALTVAENWTAVAHAPCHLQNEIVATDQARCEQHCHPVIASVDHAAPLTVPAALLTEAWAMPRLRHEIAGEIAGSHARIAPRSTAPPLTVRHCTFQI